jgi:hypothetical protein
MQEGILISADSGTASYCSVSIWEALASGSPISVSGLEEAWRQTASKHSVFSTIFLNHPETGRFIQVVLNEPNKAIICQVESEPAIEFLTNMEGTKGLKSQPQCFFTICTYQQGTVACRLDMTHALMDALSLPIIVKDLERAYSGQGQSLTTPFGTFVGYIQQSSTKDRLSYWREYLSGVKSCHLPGDNASAATISTRNRQYKFMSLPSSVTAPMAKTCRAMGMTRSAFLHLAWSLVLSYFTGMRQVCFGYLSSGRDAPIEGVDNIISPLLSMLIAYVDLDQRLTDVVHSINQYNITHLDNQHVSLAEIQHEMSVKSIFNTNITVRELRRDSAVVVGGGMRLIEVLEEDPHEVCILYLCTRIFLMLTCSCMT